MEAAFPLLERDLHVACVPYDGFDETENTVFPDMLTETEKLKDYIQKSFGGRLCAACGCSMGGSFVGLRIQRRNIHVDHGILAARTWIWEKNTLRAPHRHFKGPDLRRHDRRHEELLVRAPPYWYRKGSIKKERQHNMLPPLDCPTAKPGGAVGGGQGPVILPAHWLGWVCHFLKKMYYPFKRDISPNIPIIISFNFCKFTFS